MKFQKARKDHQCDLCDKKIPKGDKYWRHYDRNDLSASRKEHTNCELYKDNED